MSAMHSLVNDAKSMKVKTFLLILFFIWFTFWIFAYTFRDSYQFQNISERSIQIQKQSLDDFLEMFRVYKIPLILFDIEILPQLFQARPRSWHTSTHKCKTLCKYNFEEKNVITFAIKNRDFEGKDEKVIKELEKLGYAVHLSLDVDPRLAKVGNEAIYIPTYLWIAKNDHVIHVAFLHKRLESYYWIGEVKKDDWKITVNALAPALSDGWLSMERIGAKFPTYAQAFDFSQSFLGLPFEIDGHKVNVPYFISKFLEEYEHSHFIECNYRHAQSHKRQYEYDLTSEEEKFLMNAKKAIQKTKLVLDDIGVSFWLNGGTLLGWYRQCHIIPYSRNVDMGVFIYDFSLMIIEKMHGGGFLLSHKYGKAEDSLELSFISEENVKLNLVFFYIEPDYFWSGGTSASDGQKYKYKFPTFDICWTEFLDLKLKVPCDAKTFIEAYYGPNWRLPLRDWHRQLHPPNMVLIGKWKKSDHEVVIQNFETTIDQGSAMDEVKQGAKKGIDIPEELDKHISSIKGAKQLKEVSRQLKDES